MRPIWTPRHYLPMLIGSVLAGIYTGGMRAAIHSDGVAWVAAALELHVQEPPVWAVAVIGQSVLWLGVFLGRVMLFPWKAK